MWSPDDRPGQRPLCSECGQALAGDPDDDVTHPTGPLCGDCYRTQAFEDELWEMDASDEEDGGLW